MGRWYHGLVRSESLSLHRTGARVVTALLLAIAPVSCDGIQLPQLPPVRVSSIGLPVNETGQAILIEVQQARLDLDPTVRDPITAVATCADLVTYCYSPGARTLDACIAAIPGCSSQRPWEETIPCCPSRCREDYQRARRAGTAPMQAYDTVYLTAPTCFPGVAQAIAGNAP